MSYIKNNYGYIFKERTNDFMIFKAKPINYNKYATKLYKKAKKARAFKDHYRILVISDLHGLLDKHYDIDQVDDYFILGDLSSSDIRILSEFIPMDRAYYLHGNHDSYNQYTRGINLHGKVYGDDIKIAGIEGSHRYKNSFAPLYTQEQSIDIANNLHEADILFTHDRAFIKNNNDDAHCGMIGISKYLCDNRVPIHIHGHIHKNCIEELPNGTKSISIRGIAIVDINDTITIKQIFDWSL